MQVLASNFIELYPSYLQMTNFMLVGFVVVLIALACLSLITSIVGLFFRQADKLKSVLSISADVRLMEPNSIPRSEGKSVRVIDKRQLK